jgi:hypothetical protein
MARDIENFTEVEFVLGRSRVAAVVVAAAEGIRRATKNSVVVSKIAGELGAFLTYSRADRLRVIGAFIASFGTATAVLIASSPVGSAPALPWGTWLGVAVCGAALIATADAFARAWAHRRRRG